MRQEPSARSKESFTISFVTTYSKMNEEFPDNEYDTDRQTDTYTYTHTHKQTAHRQFSNPIIRYTIDILYSPSSVLIPLKGGYIIDMNRINFILALTPMGVPKLHFNIKPGMGRNNAEHQHEE